MAVGSGTRTGVGGSVTIPAGLTPPTNLHVFEWRLDIQREIFDDSNFEDALNARTKIGGMYHGIGTLRCTADRNDHATLMDMDTESAKPVASFVLKEGEDDLAAAVELTFNAIIGGLTIAVVKSDRVFYDVSFETSGDIVPST